MLHSIIRSSLQFTECCTCINLSPTHLRSFCPRATKTGNPKSSNTNQCSFTANYLVKTFGLSRDTASRISEEFKFKIPEKPDALISFFKQHGFSHAQISCIIRKTPEVFKVNLETNLLPKIEFFHSLGISRTEAAKIITTWPYFLRRSLENKIIPSYNFLKNLLMSDESTIFAIKRYPAILHMNSQKVVPDNVERLLEAGVPNAKILHWFKQQPRVLLIQPDKFNVYVEKIEGIGFNPRTTSFLSAIFVMRMAGSHWSKKIETYKRWGFSEIQVLVAFRRSPWCMATSVDKIEKVLEYFIDRMCFDPLILTSSPQIMALSLQKTIIPRCSVYQVLITRGLIRKNTSLASFLKVSKKSFVEKFLLCFAEEAPEISELYHQKLHLSK